MENIEMKEFRLKKEYKKSEDFKSYYVTAALGGFKNQYDFRLAFYKDDINEVVIEREKILGDENLNESEKFEKISKLKVPCTIDCELIMPRRTVIELFNFIKRELELQKERRKKGKKIPKVPTPQ